MESLTLSKSKNSGNSFTHYWTKTNFSYANGGVTPLSCCVPFLLIQRRKKIMQNLPHLKIALILLEYTGHPS